jgi:hypothetical protein
MSLLFNNSLLLLDSLMQESFHKIEGSVTICQKSFGLREIKPFIYCHKKRKNYLRIKYASANKAYHLHHL